MHILVTSRVLVLRTIRFDRWVLEKLPSCSRIRQVAEALSEPAGNAPAREWPMAEAAGRLMSITLLIARVLIIQARRTL